jgi:hypothetical protein
MEEINFQNAREQYEGNSKSLMCSLRYLAFVFITVWRLMFQMDKMVVELCILFQAVKETKRQQETVDLFESFWIMFMLSWNRLWKPLKLLFPDANFISFYNSFL